VASVIDDINEWQGPHGSVFYVTAFFTDETVGVAGKKTQDAALEVQGLLQEAIGVEQDFTLEPKGQTNSGKDKFKILGFGTPGGAATYTAPGVRGGGALEGDGAAAPRGRPPEPSSEQASIRASVALKAAVELLRPAQEKNETGEVTPAVVTAVADWMYDWLESKTSDASSAYSNGSGTVTPVAEDQAGASEDSGGGVESKGKEPAPPPARRLVDVLDPHIHDWQPHPNLHGWLTCECGENRKKYAP
jgi:hypothetical protein